MPTKKKKIESTPNSVLKNRSKLVTRLFVFHKPSSRLLRFICGCFLTHGSTSRSRNNARDFENKSCSQQATDRFDSEDRSLLSQLPGLLLCYFSLCPRSLLMSVQLWRHPAKPTDVFCHRKSARKNTNLLGEGKDQVLT